jgi:hypothetical protein
VAAVSAAHAIACSPPQSTEIYRDLSVMGLYWEERRDGRRKSPAESDLGGAESQTKEKPNESHSMSVGVRSHAPNLPREPGKARSQRKSPAFGSGAE